MSNVNGWAGEYEVIIVDAHTKEIKDRYEIHNLITYVGENLMRDTLAGTITNASIKYVAFGSSDAVPLNTGIQLTNELFRKPILKQRIGNHGELYSYVQTMPLDGAGQYIGEIGVFAGPDATGAINSGIMISHVPFLKRIKTDSEIIQIARKDIIRAVTTEEAN